MTESSFVRADDVVQRALAGELLLAPIRGHLAELQQLLGLARESTIPRS